MLCALSIWATTGCLFLSSPLDPHHRAKVSHLYLHSRPTQRLPVLSVTGGTPRFWHSCYQNLESSMYLRDFSKTTPFSFSQVIFFKSNVSCLRQKPREAENLWYSYSAQNHHCPWHELGISLIPLLSRVEFFPKELLGHLSKQKAEMLKPLVSRQVWFLRRAELQLHLGPH